MSLCIEIGGIPARINHASNFFQYPPDFFLMDDVVAEEKTGMLRLLYSMEPEKRRSLRWIPSGR